MKPWQHYVLQLVLIAAQSAVAAHLFPDKLHEFLTIFLASSQATFALIGLHQNPPKPKDPQ